MRTLLAVLLAAFLGAGALSAQVVVPNAVLLPSPKIQFFDQNGHPLAGGKIYSYAAGTTTPLATFTDSTGTTPNTNPLVLDAGGWGSMWITGQAYKIKVQTAAGVDVWTQDNILDVSLIMKAQLATVTGGAPSIGYKRAGSSISQTVQSALDAIPLNCADYGVAAVASDNSTAVTAWLTAAIAAHLQAACGDGNYKLIEAVSLNLVSQSGSTNNNFSGLSIKGSGGGARFIWSGVGTGSMFTFTGSKGLSQEKFRMANIGLVRDSAATGLAYSLLHLDGVAGVWINFCDFESTSPGTLLHYGFVSTASQQGEVSGNNWLGVGIRIEDESPNTGATGPFEIHGNNFTLNQGPVNHYAGVEVWNGDVWYHHNHHTGGDFCLATLNGMGASSPNEIIVDANHCENAGVAGFQLVGIKTTNLFASHNQVYVTSPILAFNIISGHAHLTDNYIGGGDIAFGAGACLGDDPSIPYCNASNNVFYGAIIDSTTGTAGTRVFWWANIVGGINPTPTLVTRITSAFSIESLITGTTPPPMLTMKSNPGISQETYAALYSTGSSNAGILLGSSSGTAPAIVGTPSNDHISIISQRTGGTEWARFSPQGVTAPNLRTGVSSNTDSAGILTLTAGTVTMGFANAGSNTSAPICTASDTTALNPVRTVVTTATLVLYGTASDVVNYLCMARN